MINECLLQRESVRFQGSWMSGEQQVMIRRQRKISCSWYSTFSPTHIQQPGSPPPSRLELEFDAQGASALVLAAGGRELGHPLFDDQVELEASFAQGPLKSSVERRFPSSFPPLSSSDPVDAKDFLLLAQKQQWAKTLYCSRSNWLRDSGQVHTEPAYGMLPENSPLRSILVPSGRFGKYSPLLRSRQEYGSGTMCREGKKEKKG